MTQNNYVIPRWESSWFDWLAWRNGSIIELFAVPHRTVLLIQAKQLLLKYAVGYCPAEEVPCRPKQNHVAVMFFYDERHWWTHLRIEEFERIFTK